LQVLVKAIYEVDFTQVRSMDGWAEPGRKPNGESSISTPRKRCGRSSGRGPAPKSRFGWEPEACRGREPRGWFGKRPAGMFGRKVVQSRLACYRS